MAKWRPKIMISKPKYTFGGEYNTPSGESYEGSYFKDYAGKIFDGNSSADSTVELLPIDSTQPEPRVLAFEINVPTDQDYERGNFVRYFLLDKRNGKIIEVRRNTYLREVVYTSYISGANVRWRLAGPIEDRVFNGVSYQGARNANKQSIELLEDRLKGISAYITDYTQFIKEQESNSITDLYTPGGEFYYKGTLQEYIGKYHIHRSMGIMEGPEHIEGVHRTLIPQNESIRLKYIGLYTFLEDILLSTPTESQSKPRLPIVPLSDNIPPKPRPSDNYVDVNQKLDFEIRDPDNLPPRDSEEFRVVPGTGGNTVQRGTDGIPTPPVQTDDPITLRDAPKDERLKLNF